VVPIAGTTRLGAVASPFSRHYLAAKFAHGHALADPGACAPCAELPERVPVVTPGRVDGAARFLHVATYLLPVAEDRAQPAPPGAPGADPAASEPDAREAAALSPAWLRLHAHLDLATGAERVVFEAGDPSAPEVRLRVQRERWLERFAPADGGLERRRWLAAARALTEAEAGVALFLPPRPPWCDDEAGGPDDADDGMPDDALAGLLAARLGGRRARLLLAPAEASLEAPLRERLARHGIETAASARLAAA